MKTRAEVLVEKFRGVFPNIRIDVETAQEYIENGGQVDTVMFLEYLTDNGVVYENDSI